MNSYTSKLYCNNCGKLGHLNRGCKEPVTSIGIICLKLNNDIKDEFDEKNCKLDKFLNVVNYNTKNNKVLSLLDLYNTKCNFLMIKRKYSLGFLEFIRGKYDVKEYQSIIKLFEYMTEEEIEKIKNKEFDDLWVEVWGKTAYYKVYEEEYKKSKDKFQLIKYKSTENNVIGLKFYIDNITPKWKTAEWGFPKGRRNSYEKNLKCAIREFEEETGYKKSDYYILDNVVPLKEVFFGTNGVLYKHIYYIAILTDETKQPIILEDNNEVGDIGWFTYSECNNLIRNYHTEKKKVLNEIFKFIVGVVENKMV